MASVGLGWGSKSYKKIQTSINKRKKNLDFIVSAQNIFRKIDLESKPFHRCIRWPRVRRRNLRLLRQGNSGIRSGSLLSFKAAAQLLVGGILNQSNLTTIFIYYSTTLLLTRKKSGKYHLCIMRVLLVDSGCRLLKSCRCWMWWRARHETPPAFTIFTIFDCFNRCIYDSMKKSRTFQNDL